MTHPPIDQQITFLYTDNLEATNRFYEEIMGFPLALDQGSCRIYRVGGDCYLGFCQRETIPTPSSSIILTLVTPEVDCWHDYLCEQDVAFEKPPELNPRYNIYHCFLRDPNGYLIEIQRFLDPAWASATGDSTNT